MTKRARKELWKLGLRIALILVISYVVFDWIDYQAGYGSRIGYWAWVLDGKEFGGWFTRVFDLLYQFKWR